MVASNDSDGYYGTGSTSGNQKRTLVLSNGETIWDFAGNVAEITSASMSSAQPTPSGFAWREWNAVSGGTFTVNPYPSNTGISGASSCNKLINATSAAKLFLIVLKNKWIARVATTPITFRHSVKI